MVVFAAVGLIAQTPDDDAGVVAIPHHHAAHPVHNGGGPQRVVAGHVFLPHAVALHVALVHHIQPQPVAEGVKHIVLRVVACADRVDVVPLHRGQIPLVHLDGHMVAAGGGESVVVYPAQLDRHPVAQQPLAVDLNAAEAYLQRLFVGRCAVLQKGHSQGVQVGRLSAPQPQVFRRAGQCQHLAGGRRALGQQCLAVPQPGTYRVTAAGFGLDAQAPVAVRFGVYVQQCTRRLHPQRHIAVDASHVPHILVLEVDGVRKRPHLHGQRVLPRVQQAGHIELHRQHRTLAEPDIHPVDPAAERRLDPAEAQHSPAARRYLRRGEAPPVLPHIDLAFVNLRDVSFLGADKRREAAGKIVRPAEALRFPAARHPNSGPVVPGSAVCGPERRVAFGQRLGASEQPVAVQA